MIDIALEVKNKDTGENLRDLLCEGLQGLPAFKDNTIIVTDPQETDAGRWAVFLNIGWAQPNSEDCLVVANCTTKVTNFDVQDYRVAQVRALNKFDEVIL